MKLCIEKFVAVVGQTPEVSQNPNEEGRHRATKRCKQYDQNVLGTSGINIHQYAVLMQSTVCAVLMWINIFYKIYFLAFSRHKRIITFHLKSSIKIFVTIGKLNYCIRRNWGNVSLLFQKFPDSTEFNVLPANTWLIITVNLL